MSTPQGPQGAPSEQPAWGQQPPPGGWGRPAWDEAPPAAADSAQADSEDDDPTRHARPASRGEQYSPPPYSQAPPQYGQAPHSGQARDHRPYSPPQYGPPPYDQQPYDQQPYGQPQYGQPRYGQPRYGEPRYGQQLGGGQAAPPDEPPTQQWAGGQPVWGGPPQQEEWQGALRQPWAGPEAGQQEWGDGHPAQADPSVSGRARRSRLPIVLGVVAVVVAAVVLVLGFVTPGFFVTKVFDTAAVQTGVQKVLTDDYGLTGVTGVTCQQKVTVVKGGRFTCQATVAGAQKQVPITITSDDGAYEVGRP